MPSGVLPAREQTGMVRSACAEASDDMTAPVCLASQSVCHRHFEPLFTFVTSNLCKSHLELKAKHTSYRGSFLSAPHCNFMRILSASWRGNVPCLRWSFLEMGCLVWNVWDGKKAKLNVPIVSVAVCVFLWDVPLAGLV